MDFLRKKIERIINEEIEKRKESLVTVSDTELKQAQGIIRGLRQGLSIVNEQFHKFGNLDTSTEPQWRGRSNG